jgi:hypothetical protein
MKICSKLEIIRFDKFNINNIDTEIKKIVENHILITYYLFSC